MLEHLMAALAHIRDCQIEPILRTDQIHEDILLPLDVIWVPEQDALDLIVYCFPPFAAGVNEQLLRALERLQPFE
jgi:hypothetical protein